MTTENVHIQLCNTFSSNSLDRMGWLYMMPVAMWDQHYHTSNGLLSMKWVWFGLSKSAWYHGRFGNSAIDISRICIIYSPWCDWIWHNGAIRTYTWVFYFVCNHSYGHVQILLSYRPTYTRCSVVSIMDIVWCCFWSSTVQARNWARPSRLRTLNSCSSRPELLTNHELKLAFLE